MPDEQVSAMTDEQISCGSCPTCGGPAQFIEGGVVRHVDLSGVSRRDEEPIAVVINNNQPGWTNIVETKPNVTLDVGTKLYLAQPNDPLDDAVDAYKERTDKP